MEQAWSASNPSSSTLALRPAGKTKNLREYARWGCWSSGSMYYKSIGVMKEGCLHSGHVFLSLNKDYSHSKRVTPTIRATTTFDFNSAPLDLNTPTFPSFLPQQVWHLRDAAARAIASRIRRLPVQTTLAENPIMTSCVKPRLVNTDLPPIFLLHGFDSSCLEWKNTYPILEKANVECWAFDILGWGFSYSEDLSSVGAAAKREHLYEFWKLYIKRPMVLVGASLGGAVAIDFALAHPEAVAKLVLVNAQGYAKGTGSKAKFPRFLAYAGVYMLKNVLLRTYANLLIHHNISWNSLIDQMNVGRLHCLMPGWSKASVDFMLSGGYNVASRISKVDKETLIIWGEQDRIISKDVPQRFKKDLPNARLVYVSQCGHLPHVEKPDAVAKLIMEFYRA